MSRIDSITFGTDPYRPELHAATFDRGLNGDTIAMDVEDLHKLRDSLSAYLETLGTETETEHECPVCAEAVAREGDTCSEHDDWVGCGQCGTLHPDREIYLSRQDGTFCPSCLHDARRSGWEG